MKLEYVEPEMNVHKYSLPSSSLITTSGLDGEDYGQIGKQSLNRNYFA